MSRSIYNWPMQQPLRPLHPSTYSDHGSRSASGYPSPPRSEAHRDSCASFTSNLPMPSQLCGFRRVLDDAQATWSVCYPGLPDMSSPSESLAYSGLAIRFKAQTPEELEHSWSAPDTRLHAPRFAPATVSPHALHDGAALGYSPMHSSISSRSHGSPETPTFDDDMNTMYTPEPTSREESASVANTRTWASPFAVSMQDEPCQYALTPGSDVDTIQYDAARDSLLVKAEPDMETPSISAFPELDTEHFGKHEHEHKHKHNHEIDEDYAPLGDDEDDPDAETEDEVMKEEADGVQLVGERSRFSCRLCDKTFDRMYNYKQHLHTHDTHRKRPFACTVPTCKQSFYRQTDLKRHHDSKHERSRAFRCEKCQVGFPRKDSLMRHRQTSCITRVRKGQRVAGRCSPVKLERVKQEDGDLGSARRFSRTSSDGADLKEEQEEERKTSYYPSSRVNGVRFIRH